MKELNTSQNRKKNSFTGKAFITALDQGVLSGVNFLIGIVFIFYSTPENYGIYTFYMSIFFLFSNIQNALINTPMMVLTHRLKEKANDFSKGLFAIFLFYLAIPFLSIMIISTINNHFYTLFSNLIVAISLSLLLIRDFFRTEEYAKLVPINALKRDIIYCLFSLTGIFFIILFYNIEVKIILFVVGISSLIVSTPKLINFIINVPDKRKIIFSLKESWNYSKWSLVGATSSWLQGNIVVFVPFILIGPTAVGFLSAARLVMTPITLLITSFSNIIRPLVSRALSNDKGQSAKKIMVYSLNIQLLILITYTLLVILGLKILPDKIIPEEYSGVENLILIWAGFYFVKIIRSNLSNYMQASLLFKSLALYGVLIAFIAVIISVFFVSISGEIGALIGNLISELIFVLVLGIQLMRINSYSKNIKSK